MNLILILLLLITVLYIFKKSNFGAQATNVPPPPSTLIDNSGVAKMNSLNTKILRDIQTIQTGVVKNANTLNTSLDSDIAKTKILKQKLEKKISENKPTANQPKSANLIKFETALKSTNVALTTFETQKKDSGAIIKTSNTDIDTLLKKLYTNNNSLFKTTVQQNKFLYTIQCLNSVKEGMYLTGLGGNLAFSRTPFHWKIVKDKELFSIQAVSDNNYLNNSGNKNKLVFLAPRSGRIATPVTKPQTPPPVSIDLTKITMWWNNESVVVKNGVLEFKRGNAFNDADLKMPFNLLSGKEYTVSILIGDINSRIEIQSLDSTVNGNRTTKMLAKSNTPITYNMVADKTTNAYYIKIFMPDQRDILKIKSITIQEKIVPVVPIIKPIPYIWTIKDSTLSGAFSISTDGNYLDCGGTIELKSVINPLTSLWTINTVVNVSR